MAEGSIERTENKDREDDVSDQPETTCGPTAEETVRVADWLTRDEWNACFFLGQEAFFRDEVRCGLCEQVAIGAKKLVDAGYVFTGLRVGTSGRLESRGDGEPPREHEHSCGEVAEGAFDDIGRARIALEWLGTRAPAVSTAWLEQLLALYDRAHGATPEAVRV